MSVVFVGAGGSGLSALVYIMHALHIPDLICIDSSETSIMKEFNSLGIRTYIGHGTYNVTADDVVIYSAATPHSPEVLQAFVHARTQRTSCAPFLYFEFLGELSKYLYTIAVSGTHGKSTTTGMSAVACIENIPETSLAILGAGVTQRAGKNSRYNPLHQNELHTIISRIISRKAPPINIPHKKFVFVVEADEFNHHFLFLEPDISIITSLDHDHVDIYPTRELYRKAFEQFCLHTKELVFAPASVVEQLPEQTTKIITISPQHFSFKHLVGGHNYANASLAYAAVSYYQKQHHVKENGGVKNSIEEFGGLHRRVELLGKNNHGVLVYSDYGHHPKEIKSTIEAFRETHPETPITCFFEAHQARRLLTFWKEFVAAFDGVSCVVVPPYTAREDLPSIQKYIQELPNPISGLSSLDSFSQLATTFGSATHGELLEDRNMLENTLQKVAMGYYLFQCGRFG